MKWRDGRRSSNVEDRRSGSVKRTAGLGGGAMILVAAVSMLLGQNPLEVIGALGGAPGGGTPAPRNAAEDQASQFVSVVLADTEDVWKPIFARSGQQYPAPKLVLYTGRTETRGCGPGQAAAGPFYCPADGKVYLDLSFLSEMQRMGASGDFAVAYVIAHEVGHHIQNVTGVARQVRDAQQRGSKTQGNQLQVRMELQADCYAGMWANHAQRQRQILEPGDIEEGLRAAAAVGDDTLQRNAGRRVTPEAFTHGSSQQRMEWFRRGYDTGDVNACDTFS